jgi:hypothetical protein
MLPTLIIKIGATNFCPNETIPKANIPNLNHPIINLKTELKKQQSLNQTVTLVFICWGTATAATERSG